MKIKHLFMGLQTWVWLALVFCLSASLVSADDHFSLALGKNGTLIVTGADGAKVGDFTAPAIGQTVSVSGGPSFQLSFGRDSNNMLSAILSPDSSHPSDLHFTVLQKKVDSDKRAVVTLTFSAESDQVTVDPGYVGLVQVNSHTVKHHDSKTAGPTGASPPVAQSQDSVDGSPLSDSGAAPGPSVSGGETASDNVSIYHPASATSTDQPLGDKLRKRHLFWAEPVTGTGKNVPHVASDEMKLLAVHGSVSVTSPGGQTKTGTNGMLVPSGSTVNTSAGSSAAVLMGGVNSVRLIPSSTIAVTQNMQGTVRHTMIDLKDGGAFSRVGREAGGTQDYEVRTPEGVAAARGTQFLDYIIHLTEGGTVHTVHAVFVNKGTVDLIVDGKVVGTMKSTSNHIVMGSMGKPKQTQEELEKILDKVLEEMAPFNVSTIRALFDYESGTYSADELALIEAELYGEGEFTEVALSQDDQIFLSTVAASFQDLVPPHVNSTNPLDAPTSTAETLGR